MPRKEKEGEKEIENHFSTNNLKSNNDKTKIFSVNMLVKIAIFSAFVVVVSLIKIPLPFFPAFLTLNLSDFILCVATFALGTSSATIIVVIKTILLFFIEDGLATGGIGSLADLLCGLAFVLPAGWIYKKYRTFKGAIVASVVATLCTTLVGCLSNWLFLIACYAKLYTWEVLLSMVRPIFKNVTQENFYSIYIPFAVLPFNLLRSFFAVTLTMSCYKKLSPILKK